MTDPVERTPLVEAHSVNDLTLAILPGLRIRHRFTKQQVADAMGRSVAAVNRVETGDPMLSEVFDYAVAFGLYPSVTTRAPYLRFEPKNLDEVRDELLEGLKG